MALSIALNAVDCLCGTRCLWCDHNRYYAAGGRAQILDQIQRLGTNIIVVSAEQSRAVADRERTGAIVTTLVDADYRALRRAVLSEGPGPIRSSATTSAPLRLKTGFLSKVSPVIGVEPDYFLMKSWSLVQGRFFDTDDLRRSSRVALLGHSVAQDLFESQNPLGERLFINRVPFEIVGYSASAGRDWMPRTKMHRCMSP